MSRTPPRDSIHELTTSLEPLIHSTVQTIPMARTAKTSVIHGLTLPAAVAQPVFPSQPDHNNHNAGTLQGQQKGIHGSGRGLSRHVVEQTACMPLSTMQPITATSAGSVLHTSAVGGAMAADRTNRPPARWFRRDGVAVANTDFKTLLIRIDLGHPLPKPGPMTLAAPQDEIHPGVNHLVTEGAFRRLPRQRLKQRT